MTEAALNIKKVLIGLQGEEQVEGPLNSGTTNDLDQIVWIKEAGAEAGDPPQPPATPPPNAVGKTTVLVVDDEVTYCNAVAKILTQHGYWVVQAHTAMHAVSVLHEIVPQLILLDVNMPEINGLALLRHLAKDVDFVNTRVVVISGDRRPQNSSAAWTAGADAFLAKPFQEHELLRVLNKVLGPSQLIVARYE